MDLLVLPGDERADGGQDAVSKSPSLAEGAPLNLLNLGVVDFPGAVVSEAVAFELVSQHIKWLESTASVRRGGGVGGQCGVSSDASELAETFFLISGDVVLLAPLLKKDLLFVVEAAEGAHLSFSAFRGVNATLADLEATALKRVVDFVAAAGLVVSIGL